MDKLKLEVMLSAIDKITRPLKSIMSCSSETARALKAAKEQLKGLNDEQSKISRFNKTVESAREASAAYKKQKESLAALVEKTNAARTAQAEMVGAVKVARREHEMLRKAFAKNDQIPGLASQLFEARRAVEKLETGYQKAINTSRRLKDEVKDETRSINAAKQRKDSYTESLKRFTAELKDAGLGTRNLAEHQSKLAESIEKTNAVAEKHGKVMQRLSAARAEYDKTLGMRNKLAGVGAATTAAGVAMGIPIMKTIKEYALAEDAATQLKVAMMGVGGNVPETFQRINDLAMQLGNKLPGTTTDYQNMMTMLIRQGMSAKAILGGLGQATAYLGVQLKMPMDAAAEFASKLQDATRTTEGDMMGLMDTIQRTFYLGVDSGNMLEAFSKMSPVMRTIKKEGLEAAKSFAPFIVMADQAGMRGEAAGNAYRKVFQYALDAKRLGKANDALDGTGKKLDFSNGKGEFGGMDKLFAQLEKLKSLDTMHRNSVINKLFGDDAETLQVLGILIDKGKAGYDEVQTKMAAQADIQRRVNEQLGTLKSLWDAASGTFTNALVSLGEAISPEVKAVVQWIGDLSEKLGNWSKQNPVLAHGLMKVAAITAISVTALGALTLAAAAVLGPLAMLKFSMKTLGISMTPISARFTAVRTAITQLGGSMSGVGASAPSFGQRIAAAWRAADPGTAHISTTQYLKTLWEKVPTASRQALDSTKLWAFGLGNTLKTGLLSAGGAVVGYTRKVWASIVAMRIAAATKWTGATSYLKTNGVAGTAGNFGKGAIDMLKSGAISMMAGFAGSLRMVGQAILFIGRAALMNPIGLMIAGIAAAAVLIYKYWEPIKAFFSGFWQGLKQGLSPLGGMFSSAFSAIGAALAPLKPVWDWLIGAFSSAWSWISNLFMPFKATGQELENATLKGKGFGLWLGELVVSVAELVGKFFNFGKNIVSGLIDGILNKWQDLKTLVTKLANMMPEWMRKPLDIHSPSRVFAQIGGHTMDGLEHGIDQGKEGPLNAVLLMSKQLAAIGAGIVLGGTAFAGQSTSIPAPELAQVAPIQQHQALQPSAVPSLHQYDRTPLAPQDNGVLRDIFEQSKQLLAKIAGGDMGRTLINQSVATQSTVPPLQDQEPLVPRKDDALGNLLEQAKQLIARITGGTAGSVSSDQPIKWDNRPPIAPSATAPQQTQTFAPVFNIYPSPGMDESALAQLVAREIEKINRQQAANARSRLADRD